MKKYSTELVVDAEEIKTTIRKYVSSYFEEAERQRDNMAIVCAFLTEGALLE